MAGLFLLIIMVVALVNVMSAYVKSVFLLNKN